MLERAGNSLREPLAKLRQPAEVGWIRATEESDEGDPGPVLHELLRQLKSHRATGAETGDDVGAARLEGADLGGEIGGQILDALERLVAPVDPRRLQAEERLIVAQRLGERAVAEDVAVMPRHRKDRHAIGRPHRISRGAAHPLSV